MFALWHGNISNVAQQYVTEGTLVKVFPPASDRAIRAIGQGSPVRCSHYSFRGMQELVFDGIGFHRTGFTAPCEAGFPRPT